jgi:signal peptidase I
VFVNGSQLTEPYVFDGQATVPADPSNHTWKVATNQFFVMGDHRANSQDSRAFGPIDKSTVIGRAWLRYWPFEQFGILPSSTESAAPSASPGPAASPAKS